MDTITLVNALSVMVTFGMYAYSYYRYHYLANQALIVLLLILSAQCVFNVYNTGQVSFVSGFQIGTICALAVKSMRDLCC